jgi:hypothetical protein
MIPLSPPRCGGRGTGCCKTGSRTATVRVRNAWRLRAGRRGPAPPKPCLHCARRRLDPRPASPFDGGRAGPGRARPSRRPSNTAARTRLDSCVRRAARPRADHVASITRAVSRDLCPPAPRSPLRRARGRDVMGLAAEGRATPGPERPPHGTSPPPNAWIDDCDRFLELGPSPTVRSRLRSVPRAGRAPLRPCSPLRSWPDS